MRPEFPNSQVLRFAAILALTLTATFPAFSQSATEQTLYNFPSALAAPTAIVQSSDGNYYAATSGAFFRIAPNGSVTTLSSFTQQSQVEALIQGIDGNFYGVSDSGGPWNEGFIFSITPTGTFTILYGFTGGSDGGAPASLIQAADGTFYGTAEDEGNRGAGVIFRYSLTSGLQVVYTFTDSSGTGYPITILQGTDGNFYGTAAGLVAGAIFKMTPAGNLTVLYTFSNELAPYILTEGSDGNFYGVAEETNGTSGYFFQVTPEGAGTLLQQFSVPDIWGLPWELIQGSDGNFYGASSDGGVNNTGAIFQMTPAGAINTMYSFSSSGQQDGKNPQALVQGSNGNFYGLALAGGAGGSGTVFEVSPSPSQAPPVQLSLRAASTSLNETVALNWNVANAHSLTNQTCFATSPAGAGNWNGVQFGSAQSGGFGGTALITPTAEGNFTYSITCGGIESATANLLVTNAASNAVNLSTTDVNLGDIAEGKSKTEVITVTNDTGVAFPFAIAMYGDPNFSQTNTCGTSIAKNKSCKITIAYASPTGTDETDGAEFVIASNGASFIPGNAIFASATAAPSGKVKLSAATHNFGKVKAGTSSSFALNLTNDANGPAVLSYSAGTVPSQFTITNNCPSTLAQGDGCVVTFTFTPTDTSTQTLTFTVTPSSPDVTAGSITLTGN